ERRRDGGQASVFKDFQGGVESRRTAGSAPAWQSNHGPGSFTNGLRAMHLVDDALWCQASVGTYPYLVAVWTVGGKVTLMCAPAVTSMYCVCVISRPFLFQFALMS